ncbi:MAG: LamG-like jellyroll fold domain-containing protein [Caldilineaceae bacterium]
MSHFTCTARLPRRLLALAFLLGAFWLPLYLSTPAHAQSIDDGLVGYWPFDEGNGSTSADQSGSGNTATLHTPNSFTNSTASTDFANPFALASVNNANSYATAPGTNIDNLHQFTVAFWVQINAQASYPDMDLVRLTNGKARFGYYDRNNLFFELTLGTVVFRSLAISHPVTDGRYHQLAGSLDGRFMQFFVDGQLISRLDTLDPLFPANGPSVTGQGVVFSSGTLPLNGALDDVRIYNRALSDSEVLALTYNCTNAQGLPASECRALVDLFRTTNGVHWTNHTNWLQNNTPCTWAGVLCNNSHVFALSLPQNNLKGSLPLTLGNLAQLVVLQLPNNGLTGALPFELGNLSQLQTLDLYGNQLSGQVPFTLGNLPALTTLRLYNNQLRGPLPSQLANLTNLLTLDLGYNVLTAVDPNLINYLNNTQPTWGATQTVPSTNLKVNILSSSSISLTWTPIAYTADAGYYEVLSTTQTSGIYKSAGKTVNKSATGFQVNNLTPGQSYSFLVRTFTPKHGLQQNDLLSDITDPVAVTLGVNRPPVAANDSYTLTQDTALTIDAAHGLLANDRDPDGDKLKIGAISGINPGSKFALNLDGSFTYTPAPGFVGTDTFTYQASDGQALSNAATVSFQVKAKPVANPATITIALDVQPDSKTNFSFSGALGTFLLDDITPQDGDAYSNSKTFTVPAGVYTVTEALPSGYLDANISCSPPTGTIVDLTKHQIVINAAAGANLTCTFVAQRTGMIIAGKYNDHNHNHQRNSNDEWLNGWQMQLHNPFNLLVATQATAGDGRTTFNNLFAGTYTVCEVQVAGWFAITPNAPNATYNAPCYTVNVTPGQAVWVRFGNSTTPLVAAADATPVEDIVVCDLPATDDGGNELLAERDPWEEEEATWGSTIFLPLVQR